MSGSTELVNLSSLLNSCITACSSHLRGCEEIIVNNLRESVQRVISHVQNEKESVQAFSEENTLTSECLMSLLTVLGDCDSILCSEILSLFNILALERSPAVLLYGLGALDTLIYLLDEHTHPLQVLNLIGKITKHIKCGAHEERVDRLLTIVTNNVLTNDMTLKPSLYTMVNLTSGSVPVQMHLRSLDRSGMLRKKILKLVCHDDNEVSIGALAALTSTGMADEFNKLNIIYHVLNISCVEYTMC
ncbi:KIAA1524 [Bugula neritina]|uniref:KIAA1524 n=1 Tax=Bugula neritina TaxID=10212 RepID=A0A7J7K520_BUGNE|nr:KIAA1524 [Bugula neritina]